MTLRISGSGINSSSDSSESVWSDRDPKHVESLVRKAVDKLDLPYKKTVSHPYSNEVQKLTIQWIHRYRIIEDHAKIEKINASKFADFLGRAHPRADKETLSIVVDFATWLFIYDDMIEKCSNQETVNRFHERSIAVLSGEKVNDEDDPLTLGLSDIAERITKICSSLIWRQRLIKEMQRYCNGTLWELFNREKSRVPLLEEYQCKRLDTSGTQAMFCFIEMIEKVQISQTVFESDYFKKICRLGANLVNWENDLLSAPKEIKSGDLHNLVFVYQGPSSSGYEKAIESVCEDLKDDLERFRKLAKEIPDFGSETEAVKKYLTGIQDWVAAHHFWAIESPRYVISKSV
ncbi:putative terpene synthase family protein [Waddlia chondrophila 2032/99]|uniref:Terpene synthase n=2 Tax=Waddlia chondrophila TaxID=71667 RepID=D6YUT2_WADCW|nr:terpene synthase [Waddlia chondrophila]ADI37893.1 putative terpene synthase family protein [Waddlia chondrophila WSU 86-1044]CCB91264.1 putative terpene synthase family protein [Waddlia chondrophila 2032/99]